jgi:hypothetical protein
MIAHSLSSLGERCLPVFRGEGAWPADTMSAQCAIREVLFVCMVVV